MHDRQGLTHVSLQRIGIGIFTLPEVRSIAISVSVCSSVCLSVCPLAYLENHTSKFRQIFDACYNGHGSVLLCRQCDVLCISGFADDVYF